jgi:hypothetical protein
MEDEASLPYRSVGLIAQCLAGFRSAGYTENEAKAKLEASIAAAYDRDPVDLCIKLLGDKDEPRSSSQEELRSRSHDAVQGFERGLTFENVLAYFAEDGEVTGEAREAVQHALLDAIIVSIMEDEGIKPDLSKPHGV